MPTALITGGSGGIGLALARCFARNGYDLHLIARNSDRLERAASELTATYGSKVTWLAADLTLPEAVGRVAESLARQGGEPDVLVNNAGVGVYGPFLSTDLARELAMIRVNIDALVALTKLVLPGMIERGRGRIANVSSTAGFQPGPGMAVYYASKAFVLSFSEALAHELAGSGVTVTAVCPGPTPTGFQREAGAEGTRLLKTPLLMTADRVAEVAYRGIMRGRRVVVPGLGNRLLAWGAQLAPRRVAMAVVAMVNAKRG